MGDLDLTEQFYEFYKISREKSKGSTEKKPLFPSAKQKDYDEFLKGNLNFIGEAKNLLCDVYVSKWYVFTSQKVLNSSMGDVAKHKEVLFEGLKKARERSIGIVSELLPIKPDIGSGSDSLSVQVMVILNGMSKRIDLLSVLADQLSKQHQGVTHKLITITSYGKLVPNNSSPDLISHRNSVIRYVKNKIDELSVIVKTLDDIRIRRKLLRQDPFGISKEKHQQPREPLSPDKSLSILKLAKPNVIRKVSSPSRPELPNIRSPAQKTDNAALENSIPQEQLLELENRNSELLEELNARIHSVNRAEEVLNDVSNLHLQISSHLQIQKELSSSIHDDAWKTTKTMESANVYIQGAMGKFQSARLWKVLIPIIASLALLMLDNR